MTQNIVNLENTKHTLRIRSAVQSDAKQLNEWWNDGKVMAHAGFPNGLHQSIEETKLQIQKNKGHLSQLCIIEKEQVPIGELSFSILKASNEKDFLAEIGIKICNESFQNKGFGTIILQMLLEYLFHDSTFNQKVTITKVILDTNLKNIRAQHVYEKIGFQKVRVNIDAWKDQLGVSQSSIDYEFSRSRYENGVRFICDSEEKATIATSILNDLPDWFGLPDSTKEYVANSKEMPFFAYYKDHTWVGFIVLKKTSAYTAEIYVMGVLKKYHHQGIGEELYHSFLSYAKNSGFEYLQVKTVQEGHYEEYDLTNRFYKKMGFRELECLPTLWDEWNPCQILIQSIILL